MEALRERLYAQGPPCAHLSGVTGGELLNPTVGLIADVSKAAGDAITDSLAEAAKRLVPIQSYFEMRQRLDLLTTDE